MRRHDLLRVGPDCWPRLVSGQPAIAALPGETRALVSAWATHGWPVIVRRRSVGESAGHIPVALPLPPAFGKLRLAFAIPHEAVSEAVAPVSLADAMTVAPGGWRAQIDALIALGDRLVLSPNVFGALLWERLTGLRYLRPRSDLDLLWPMPRAETLPDLLDGLARLDAEGPARLDGEIEVAGDGGVNWREVAGEIRSAGGAVLVKTMEGVDIRCVRTLFG